jgi:hypothetical protein
MTVWVQISTVSCRWLKKGLLERVLKPPFFFGKAFYPSKYRYLQLLCHCFEAEAFLPAYSGQSNE